MKASYYNLFIPVKDDDVTLLYNTLSQSILVFSNDYVSTIEGIINDPDNSADEKLMKDLLEGNFIIQDNFNELDYIKYRYYLHAFSKNAQFLMLLPTLSCNFACTYCKQVRHDKWFSDDTVERIIKFVRKSMATKRFLNIGWFGGEPLLCKDNIYYMSEKFIEICEQNKSVYNATVCTNGSLLTNNFVKDVNKLGITGFQITIDGPPKWHNQLRPFMGNKPSFDIIHKNIENFIQADTKAKLSLRVNISDASYDEALALLNLFSEDVKKKVSLYFKYIFSTKAAGFKKFVDFQASDPYWQLYFKAYEMGWNAVEPKEGILTQQDRFYNCAEADRINDFHVGPDGKLYKCSEMFENSDVVGYLDKNGNAQMNELGNYLRFMMVTPFDRGCSDCKYLPIHMGGCRLGSFNTRGKRSCPPEQEKDVQGIVQFVYHKRKIRFKYKIGKRKYRVLNLRALKWLDT